MNQFVASSSEMYEPVPDTADSHEFEDVVDAIVDHGLYSDDVLLLRLTERRCELAVPANIRRHWTINPFARWCDRQMKSRSPIGSMAFISGRVTV